MNFKYNFVLIVLAVCSLLIFSGCTNESDKVITAPKSIGGVLDLTDWDFEKDGIIPLDGEWEFYWEEMLEWSDFQSHIPVKTGNIYVPGSWNKYKIDGKKLSSNGYATYRLTVVTSSTSNTLALKIPRIFTAYSLWSNDGLLVSSGKIAKNKEGMVPQYYPKIVTLNPNGTTFQLIVQVSNFSHRSGGILESIKLGTERQIIMARENKLALELLLFGCLMIMGIYHIVLFSFRKKNLSPLYFGVYCVLIAIRTLFVGEIFFIQLFPDFNWELQHKIQTLTFYAGVPIFATFVNSVFTDEFPKSALKFSQAAGALFCLLVLLTPARIFTYFNPLYQVITLIVIIFVVRSFILACARKRSGALIFTIGGLFFILTALNDIVFLSIPFNDNNLPYLRYIIVTGNLSSLGLIILVFSQSIMLAANFSKAFSQVEVMSEQLIIADKQKNTLLSSLEDKVRERTMDLEESNRQLESVCKNLSLMERTRKDLLTSISHDLRTPMTLIRGYTEAFLDDMVNNKEDQKKYLKLIHNKIIGLSNLTDNIFELSQLESREIKLELQKVSMADIMAKLDSKYRYDVENAGLNYIVEIPDEALDYIYIDINQMDRVFSNLIYNAIKHTPKGSITVTSSLSGDYVLYCISDTGKGISHDDIPYVFDRFYTGSKSRNSSSSGGGLGLAIVKEIVEYHGGSVRVKSTPNEGSSFIVTISRSLELL
ncbi:sensor histidine kinase [Ruminiclostridium cellulolyticum]|uniref:histidine kinase n=1 Tax=Ruminiclostridium cellulolyticum (strain ATCC 35319 / DSM 5812 / JCM 6584 / H10) TaxID=394503 RepID=B8I271_RUMCH|nr:sensor histidine kinase [Ruminiclostridium cellulolyticum]ACL75897.1 histidine kinase [Ruminiclostridium cellulolyticum H10]